MLTFAGSNIVQVELVALLGPLEGTFGGEEVAGRVVGLVVGAADLEKRETSVSVCLFVCLPACLTLTCSNSPSAGGQLVGS